MNDFELCKCGHKKEEHYDCKGFCQKGIKTYHSYERICNCNKFRFDRIGKQ